MMGTPDPEQLIDPSVRKLSSLIKSEKLPAEELAKPCSLKWPQTVPQELSLFIESLSLAALAQVLEKAPDLYWHPYVYRQLTYLRRLRCDAGAWERLGWEWEVDEESGEPHHPQEVGVVCEALERLVEAHVRGLLPDKQLIQVHASKKPGPKAGFENPDPAGPWAEWVEVATLDEDERALRKIFRRRSRELRILRERGEKSREDAKARIEQIALEALEQSGAGWWSSAWQESEWLNEQPSGPEPPPPPPNASQAEWLAYLEKIPAPRIIRRWKSLPWGDTIDRMFRPKGMGRVQRSGKPAYLAYATLGALLGESPEVMMDALDYYRYPRHGRPRS
jgi:hypothetical protein